MKKNTNGTEPKQIAICVEDGILEIVSSYEGQLLGMLKVITQIAQFLDTGEAPISEKLTLISILEESNEGYVSVLKSLNETYVDQLEKLEKQIKEAK